MTSRRSRTFGLGVTCFMMVGALAACGSDKATDTAGDPATPTMSTVSDSPTPTATLPTGVAEKKWLRQAMKATRAGLPAFVPNPVPDGWVVTSAAFDKNAPTWEMHFANATGAAASIMEADVPAEKLVGAEASKGEKVDVSGTGAWQAWTLADGQQALSLEVKHASVLVVGPTAADVEAIAASLITADSAAPSGDE